MNKPILYSADWCAYCQTAKKWLAKNGVAYELRDVDDAAVREEMNKKADGNQTIPTLVIGDTYYVNPSIKVLKELFVK
jgi:glutaredoxin